MQNLYLIGIKSAHDALGIVQETKRKEKKRQAYRRAHFPDRGGRDEPLTRTNLDPSLSLSLFFARPAEDLQLK